MKKLLPLLCTLALAGCQQTLTLPSATVLASDSLGGLASSVAAHASVEAVAPLAFVLTPESAGFLQALTTTAEPQRIALANRLKADSTITSAITNWSRAGAAGRLAVLQRVATIEGEVMHCQVPTVKEEASTTAPSGMLAFFQAESGGLGEITIYSNAIASGGGYLALSMVIHEMRHAVQYQLVSGDQTKLTADEKTLATGYRTAWETVNALGGESKLSYGDYVHLAVEFDAFQAGNQVATLMSGGTFDQRGSGFVDTQYVTAGTPNLDLTTMLGNFTTSELTGAVNLAQAKAEPARSPVVSRQRPVVTRGGRAGR
ncbi:MAG: hypothetical protein JWM80_6469 [Cyanobacteria bacterium RYN_339]|nr:hypothetical protein [Cyanobacteria bacterium RYN_339]